MIKLEITSTLKNICEKLSNTDIKWVVIGSLSLALQGVDVEPHDIDILTDKEGIYAINTLLKEYEVEGVTYEQSEFFCSYRSRYRIGNINIEVIAELEEKHNGKWVSLSDRLEDQIYVNIDNLRVLISSLEKQLSSYEKSKRPQDVFKTQKIREFLGTIS